MKVSSSKVMTSTANVDSDIHQASMLALPWFSSSPSEGVPGGTPSPRKSNEVKAKMAAHVAAGEEMPWVRPGDKPQAGEKELFVAVHL